MRRTDSYNRWLHTAGWEIISQKPAKIRGKYNIFIAAVRPDKRKRDLDNLAKPIGDLLVTQGVIRDDSDAEMIVMRWTIVGEGVSVRIEKAG
jgi:crossover junction endodeoxyribonuclease RusA